MLVLNRTEKSKVFLHNLRTGDTVELEVVEIRCGPEPKVRLGLTAPEWIHIERDDMKCKEPKPSQQNLKKPEGD